MKIMTAMYTLRKGGAYDRFIIMLEAFLERGWEVHCLSSIPIKIKNQFFYNHVIYLPFKLKNDFVNKLIIIFLFPFCSFLIGWREKVDLYIAFNSLYAFIQAGPKWILKRPMVTLIRGDFTFGFKIRGSLKHFMWLIKVIEYLGLIASNRILAVNMSIHKNIMKVIRSRKNIDVGVLFNNIPSLNNQIFGKIYEIGTRYGIPKDGKLLVTAGILNRGKNIETLLRCIPKIETKKLFVLIIGDGSTLADSYYQKYLRELIKELGLEKRVIFTGWLDKEDLWKVFRTADLFVMSSLSEGMPNAMLEALGFDLPCMGSDIPGIKDILKYDELMFSPLDEEAIAYKVDKLFSDVEYFNYIRRLCQERKELFSFDWKEKVFQLATKGIIS